MIVWAENDPGAIGARAIWVDLSVAGPPWPMYIRNRWNDGWVDFSTAMAGGGGGGGITVDVFANRPISPAEGDLFYATDGIGPQIYDGSKWLTSFRGRLVTPPVPGDFTTININGLDLTDEFDTCKFSGTRANAGEITARVKAAPSTPYTIVQAWRLQFLRGNILNTWRVGLACFRQSSTGELSTWGIVQRTASPYPFRIEVIDWNSPSSASGTVHNPGDDNVWIAFQTDVFLRIVDDGTDRRYSISPDGLHWDEEYTVARNNFLTADQVGFACSPGTVNDNWSGRLIGWDES